MAVDQASDSMDIFGGTEQGRGQLPTQAHSHPSSLSWAGHTPTLPSRPHIDNRRPWELDKERVLLSILAGLRKEIT